MRRRHFLKGTLRAGVAGTVGLRVPLALADDGYQGKLLLSVQAQGGWDPTCFCDPKTNTPGEPIINHWAEETDEVPSAGNLPYAPFADNAAFFEKYHDRMLVINGIDMETNSHDVGTVNAWTGRGGEAFPTLSAVHAAHHAPGMTLACTSFGAYTRGATLLPVVDFGYGGDSISYQLASIAEPARGYLHASDWQNIQRYHAMVMTRLKNQAKKDAMPARKRSLARFDASFNGAGGLAAFADALGNSYSTTPWKVAIAAFKAGVAASADLAYGGFDTHSDNDGRQADRLTGLTSALDEVWNLAEEHGLADRLIVVIGSEFGRTNYYNESDGKDHWPIGSLIVMEKHQPWTDRVVAATDPLHFALPVDPQTLEPNRNGNIIYPNEIHKALRRYLGLDGSIGDRLYPFRGVRDLALFEPS